MDRSEVAIIIPAWNESKTISKVINDVSSDGTAIVVNDCSDDDTESIAHQAGAIVISHDINKGYETALSTGFEYASKQGYKLVITFDADGQHNAALLKTYIYYLVIGYDLVIGIRPKPARIAEYLFALYSKIRFKIKDPLCGMKGYRMEVYNKRGWFDSYGSIGAELVLWAADNGFHIKQIPVPIANREDVPRFGRLLRANIKILKALVRTIFLLKK